MRVHALRGRPAATALAGPRARTGTGCWLITRMGVRSLERVSEPVLPGRAELAARRNADVELKSSSSLAACAGLAERISPQDLVARMAMPDPSLPGFRSASPMYSFQQSRLTGLSPGTRPARLSESHSTGWISGAISPK